MILLIIVAAGLVSVSLKKVLHVGQLQPVRVKNDY